MALAASVAAQAAALACALRVIERLTRDEG